MKYANKSLGQNFLIDSGIARRIAESGELNSGTHTVEIGAGLGALTMYLCEAAGFVSAIEFDRRLITELESSLSNFTNYEIINADALKCDFSALKRDSFNSYKVVSNLPYNITSQVLIKLIESKLFDSITVMVQREFALRAAAAPGSADYGSFSVFAQYHTQPEVLFNVPPEAFSPRPSVTSSVLRLRKRAAPPCEIANESLFFRTVRAAFAQRRKTLVNALSAGFPELGKDRIRDIITSCGHSDMIRGETLGIPEFAAISSLLSVPADGFAASIAGK